MKQITLKLSKAVEFFCKLKENPAELFESLRKEVSSSIAGYLDRLMETEITFFLGRKPYERKVFEHSTNYRNGAYERRFSIKGIGEIKISIPRDRKGTFSTSIIPRYKRHEEEIARDVAMMYLGGLSTRNVEMISEKLLGCKVSHGFVSESNKMLHGAVSNWRNRDLSEYEIHYMYIDGVNFDMRVGKTVENVPVLVAVGVDKDGYKTVLGFQSGDKESATSWREFFKDLKNRGLQAQDVKLGILDGLPGMEKVFEEEFSNAQIQRCQVHLARNVLAKVPRKIKEEVADSLRDIFYASSRAKAMNHLEIFKQKWEPVVPSAVQCLERSVERSLTYLNFDESLWISLRTTNPIERVNKEYKRRTNSMEIAGGEASLYNILAFVSVKMETTWRKSPIGSTSKKLWMLQEKFV